MVNIVRIGAGSSELAPAEEIGAKAAILARVASAGVTVPPAFVLPISLGAAIAAGDHDAKRALKDRLKEGMAFLEDATGLRFGDRREPLLVSVRSGAARSMPGMLDSLLDVGCTTEATRGLIRLTGNPRFAWDCRRRFLECWAETVLGLDRASLAAKRDALIAGEGALTDRDLDSEALERLAAAYEALVAAADQEIADDPMQQLVVASRAVFDSWMSERACTYRRLQGLDDLKGTAVMVQAMVFGNKGSTSGAGVAFSRDPSSGAREPQIDVLFEAQGEDVVSGRRTPKTEKELARSAPAVAAELRRSLVQLEKQFKDVQDIEFTIEDGRLWILQSRAAKRTARAALKIAVDLVHEGLISEQEGLARVRDLDLEALSIATFAGSASPAVRGIGASGGVAVGLAAFDAATAERMAGNGDRVVLIRSDINTADVKGLAAARGIVTASGGRTAHAALIARQLGKACVVGCAGLAVNSEARVAKLDGKTIREGDWISVDGTTGEVFLEQREIVRARPEAELNAVAAWRADAHGRPDRNLVCVE
ncbi:MAG TPA: PEP/pyruvate-binding domain-containing protein [Methyloceanibacter sp.]|nr:PEP/pyruvate-binding domain-containing protein [Methyloceanibacter sp.]